MSARTLLNFGQLIGTFSLDRLLYGQRFGRSLKYMWPQIITVLLIHPDQHFCAHNYQFVLQNVGAIQASSRLTRPGFLGISYVAVFLAIDITWQTHVTPSNAACRIFSISSWFGTGKQVSPQVPVAMPWYREKDQETIC